MSWTLIFQASTATFAALVGYLLLWRYLHRAPAPGLQRAAGKLLGEQGAPLATAPPGESVLPEAAGPVQLALDDRPPLTLRLGGASLRVLPGPGDRRRDRDLRAGDAVLVHGFEGPLGFQVVRVVRSGWREPRRWLEPAAAAAALLAVVSLGRARLDQLRVAELVPAGAPRLAQLPSPASLLELTRRIDRVYSFAGDAAAPPGEPGQRQGFLEYVAGDARIADGERQRLYLQPIGHLSPGEQRGLRRGAEFLSRFFCLPVAIARPMALEEIPDASRRVHAESHVPQLQSTTIIHDLLRARLPRDAVGLLGVTAVDLWPGEGWNAVRGQASTVARVGIVSLYRCGLADGDAESFRLFLRRTLKLMVHEASHLLSMWHCRHDGCVMSGRNELELFDRRHPLLCPDCLAKLVWATRCDPAARDRALSRFCRQQGLLEEAALFQVLGQALRGL